MARAMSTRCRSPWDKTAHGRLARWPISTDSINSRAFAASDRLGVPQ